MRKRLLCWPIGAYFRVWLAKCFYFLLLLLFQECVSHSFAHIVSFLDFWEKSGFEPNNLIVQKPAKPLLMMHALFKHDYASGPCQWKSVLYCYTHRPDIMKTSDPTRLPAQVAWMKNEILARRVKKIFLLPHLQKRLCVKGHMRGRTPCLCTLLRITFLWWHVHNKSASDKVSIWVWDPHSRIDSIFFGYTQRQDFERDRWLNRTFSLCSPGRRGESLEG